MDLVITFGVLFLIVLTRSIIRVERRNQPFHTVGLNPYRSDRMLDEVAKRDNWTPT